MKKKRRKKPIWNDSQNTQNVVKAANPEQKEPEPKKDSISNITLLVSNKDENNKVLGVLVDNNKKM